jgi:hypothetical protein
MDDIATRNGRYLVAVAADGLVLATAGSTTRANSLPTRSCLAYLGPDRASIARAAQAALAAVMNADGRWEGRGPQP